ncbi:amino acid ABC transporter permease [Phytoactinopolyspora endophytica]|uniref:amino acid ABC transporter permease n=1 Tax=Phytoactinopolyspora endophytica TaxID=1642495 RepID=UPI00101E1A90|nr:ABC transporter permease subunit [Phytoactinopolyspora endophytica]
MSARQQPNVTGTRPPPWRDERVLRVAVQVAFLAGVGALLWLLGGNLVRNMRAQGMRTDFGFLDQPAGFALTGTDFSSRDSIGDALLVGLQNTIVVSIWGIILATVLGVLVGIARLSTNWLVRKCAAGYVEALRNVPLIVFLLFLYLAVLQRLPRINDAFDAGGFVFSNRGLYAPWVAVAENSGIFLAICAGALALAAIVGAWRTRRFDATGEPHHRVLWGGAAFLIVAGVAWAVLDRPVSITLPSLEGRNVSGGYELSVEHGALLLGLLLYMAAFIAEIVRGSILAVPKGQSEASHALGLGGFQRYRYVVLPQALRIAIPPTGNEFINLAKNSALGIAIAFPELLRVTRIAIGQGQPAPQLVGIMMLLYLAISLLLSVVVNLLNRRLTRRGA